MSRQTRVPGAAAAAHTSEAASSAEAKPAPSARAADGTDLPNAIDIDAKEIRGPVLTKQGWVCPDESARVPRDAHKP